MSLVGRIAVAIAIPLLPATAGAEDPDVGQTPGTAAAAYGMTTIAGTLSPSTDVDLYRICISDGAAFSVSIGGLGAGNNDGQLWLFNSSGHGVAFNDDQSGSLVPAFSAGAATLAALAPGEYYLGVSNFNVDPVADGPTFIFPSTAGSGTVVGPLVSGQPLTGWDGDPNANAMTTYTLLLTAVGCDAPSVVAPADVTVAATSSTGAVVTFPDASASDFLGGALDAPCLPESGTTFPIGTTTVTCTATDSLGVTGSGGFDVTVVDHGPTLTVPEDITVDATGPAGAVVTFAATATDAVDGDLVPTCSPVSGSTFPIGTTIVSCSVTDSGSNMVDGSFGVTVENTAPTVSVPGAITVEAEDENGAVVTFDVAATDVEDGALAVTCTPGSGSTLPLGSTTVTCSATDSMGLTGTGGFTVTVTTPRAPGPSSPPVTVTAPPVPTPSSPSLGGSPLPRTGASSLEVVRFGLVVALAGAVLVAVGRRRS